MCLASDIIIVTSSTKQTSLRGAPPPKILSYLPTLADLHYI